MKFPRPLIYIPKIFSKRSLTARETNTPKPTPFSQKKKKKKKKVSKIWVGVVGHPNKKCRPGQGRSDHPGGLFYVERFDGVP
jgi:hypothetical protein